MGKNSQQTHNCNLFLKVNAQKDCDVLIQAGSDNEPCHAECCGEGRRPEVVTDFFFCLSFLFGDKLAAARRSPVPNKTSSRRSRKIATVSTTNFHHVGANEKRRSRGQEFQRREVWEMVQCRWVKKKKKKDPIIMYRMQRFFVCAWGWARDYLLVETTCTCIQSQIIFYISRLHICICVQVPVSLSAAISHGKVNYWWQMQTLSREPSTTAG